MSNVYILNERGTKRVECGRIVERMNGMVRVRCGDGKKIWFEESRVERTDA